MHDGHVVDGRHSPQLVVAAYEGDGRGAGGSLQRRHSIRGHRLGSAFETDGTERGERHAIGDETARCLADQHLAVARFLLQPCGHVHGVADDIGVVVADDDLARVDCDTEADRADGLVLLVRELAKRALHGHRRTHGANGIILGDAWNTESGHHAVAEQLDDRPAVGFDGSVRSFGSSDP